MVEAAREQILYVVAESPSPTVTSAGAKRHKKQESFLDKLTVPQVAMVERELKQQRLPPIGDDFYIGGVSLV